MKIREIMKSPVISVTPSETIGDALDIMYRENINGMPVTNEKNELLGIIVRADIYRFLIDPGHYKSCPVDWVMTKDVVVSTADEEVIEVAKKLRKKDVIAIPVVDDEKVVGIISIEDLLDYYIGLEIKE